MEALLRKLEENQQMTDEAASRLQPNETPLKKYTSIFFVDGKPILPPLMTSEKRKEMQKFKQEAIKIERKLKQQRLRNVIVEDAEGDETTLASLSSFGCDNISQDSPDEVGEVKQLQNKASTKMMIKRYRLRSEGGADGGDITGNKLNSYSTNSDSITSTGFQQYSKIQKLKKSQTLIYNLTEDLGDGMMQAKQQNSNANCEKCNGGANFKLLKKPTYLCLNNNNNNDLYNNAGNSNNNVPIICINPPTPLMIEKDEITKLGKSLKSCAKITDSAVTISSDDSSDSQSFPRAKMNLQSADDKTEAVLSTISTAASASGTKTSSIMCEGIKKFERMYKENGSSQSSVGQTTNYTVTSNSLSSPEKHFRDSDSQKTNFDSLDMPPAVSRSVTSPSFKVTHNENNPLSSNSVYLETSKAMPESELIRSNSFTLQVPSKALVDHMRQQQQQQHRQHQQQQYQQQQISIKNNTNNGMNKMRRVSPLGSARTQSRLTQDTVESKAKRKVHRVETKTSRSALQCKGSSSKFSSSLTVMPLTSPSPTSSSIPYVYPSAYNSNGNNNQKSFHKPKRSPYESAFSSSPSLTKPYTRKLNSTSESSSASALSKQVNMRQSKTQLQVKRQQQQQLQQSQHQNTYKNANDFTGPLAINLMDGEKKDLFMQLLAQQEEERRKLQEAFEIQQKMLLNQLNERSPIIPESPKYHLNNGNHNYDQHQQNHLPQHHIHGNVNDTAQLNDDYVNDRIQSTPQKSSSVLSCNTSGISIKELNSFVKVKPSSLSSLQINTYNNDNSNDLNNTLSSIDSFTPTCEQINVMRRSLTNNVATTTTQNSINSINSNNSNISLKSTTSTPRRRLFVQDVTALNACNLRTNYTNNNNNKSSISNDKNSSGDRQAAATIINARVRGYLVRRLFQTEHIQLLVQTIRDTLIFVLHLHMESIQNTHEALEPANIKLKGRLLQQLYSANRRLHSVLFETTVKERMNIIAQDRKRIRNKLMALQKKG